MFSDINIFWLNRVYRIIHFKGQIKVLLNTKDNSEEGSSDNVAPKNQKSGPHSLTPPPFRLPVKAVSANYGV